MGQTKKKHRIPIESLEARVLPPSSVLLSAGIGFEQYASGQLGGTDVTLVSGPPVQEMSATHPDPTPGLMPAGIPQRLSAEVAEIVAEPVLWWNSPNTAFGARPPIDLIGSTDEALISEWASSVKHGFVA